MSVTFTKLFSSITASTVWCEPDRTRLAWITMLAMSDSRGRVWASIPGLANMARIPVEDARTAIASFLAPDPDSRTKEHDGRRIEEIDGGWRLLNHEKYRAIRDEESIKESKRKYINERRAKEKAAKVGVENVELGRHNAEAEAEAEAGTSNPLSGNGAGPRAGSERRAEARIIAARVIAYLNDKAGTRYKPGEANLKFPVGRILSDDATEKDLKAVVDAKVTEWAHREDMRQYLSPDTLFNATKWGKYVGQLSMPVAVPPAADGKILCRGPCGRRVSAHSNYLCADCAKIPPTGPAIDS